MRKKMSFEDFHAANPMIYDMLVAVTRIMKAKKTMKRWSVYAAYELVRYQWNPHTRTFDEYKLPNEHRPKYSRLIMKQEADLNGFFRIRGDEVEEDGPKQGTLMDLFEDEGL